MSNDFNDDFDSDYIDDNESFYGDEDNSAEGSSGSPFLIAIAALVGVFIISALCIMVVISSRRAGNEQQTAAEAIAATNAIIEETNIAVTVAIAETEAAKTAIASVPTFTPEVTNSPTSEIADPTDTPVVDITAPTANGTADVEEESTGEPGGNTDGTTEPGNGSIVIGATATATPTPISATNGGGKDSTLPDTGLEIWVFALIGLVLIAVLFAARRLRTN